MSVKGMWDKLKYWQRGGVVGILFGIFLGYLFVVRGISPIMGKTPDILRLIWSLLASPLAFYTPVLYSIFEKGAFFGIKSQRLLISIIWMLSTVPYFVLGSALGKIYNRIKFGDTDKSSFFSWILTLVILIGYILSTMIAFLATSYY